MPTGKVMSQADLGALSGVSRRAIQDIEAGRANASMATIAAIAGALEVSLAQLLDVTAKPPSRRPTREQLVGQVMLILSSLSEKEIRAIFRAARVRMTRRPQLISRS